MYFEACFFNLFDVKVMKKILFFVFIVASLAFTKGDANVVETLVVVTPDSTLSVNGVTNINTFECNYNVSQIKNPISVFFEKIEGKLIFKKTALILDNTCFDCGGKGINSDFQKILKSDEHPKIYLFLKELESINDKALVHVEIKMAGVTNKYKIPVTLTEGNNIFIQGKVNISLKDFEMKPPKKLFGLIEVEDNINIDFKLEVEECQP